jgi:predicted TIM-barrel fold metal-dependent hydrolase
MQRQYTIIDADAHVNPPPEFWQEYLPQRFRAAAPRIESADDCDYVVFEGKRSPFVVMTAQAGNKAENYKRFGRRSETRAGGWESRARCADMDTDGVDAAVIYGGGPLATRDTELHLASFEAYNRWLADFCKGAPDRLFGIGYIPMLEVEAAIDAMQQLAKLGLKGILIPAFPQSKNKVESDRAGASGQAFALTGDPLGPRRYSDPEFDPFWKAAVELQMPVHMHLGARITRSEPELFMSDLVMSKLAMAEPIAIMTLGGVFMRHPELKFVSVESGVGWFGFVAAYMDKIWQKHRHWTGNKLKEAPSFYMDRQVYGTFLEETVGLILRNEPGGRNIMWSSDYPHSETSWPNSRQVIERVFATLPAAEKRRMVCDIAKSLYCA